MVDQAPVVAHAGAVALAELADRVGLTSALGRRANQGQRHGSYDRGQVLRDLAVMLADGGDCVADLAALRDQPLLFGQVASTATAWRVVAEEVAADPKGWRRSGARWRWPASTPGRQARHQPGRW